MPRERQHIPEKELTGLEREALVEGAELAGKYPEKLSKDELETLEKEQQEVLRLEKKVDQLAQHLTELWRVDDGWALRFQNEGRSGYGVEDDALVDRNRIGAINRLEIRVGDLRGKEPRTAKGKIARESELNTQQRALRERYNAVRGEYDTLMKALQASLSEMYRVLEKIQHRAKGRFDTIARFLGRSELYTEDVEEQDPASREPGPYKRTHREPVHLAPAYRSAAVKKGTEPLDAEELLRSRFPFAHSVYGRGERVNIDEGKLLKSYGYTERGSGGKFDQKQRQAA